MIEYVTYKRVSTAEQGRSGLGLEAQERDIRLFLENYSAEPWEVIGEFIEVHSGADNNRPQLAAALDLARKRRAVLLVAKLDRLSRRVAMTANLMEDRDIDLKVACLPNADKFQLHIYAALAEKERDFISERTKAALREAKARGKKLGGLRDATMRRNEALKEQADDRAAKLKGIIGPMRERGASLREIVTALNNADIASPRGGRWHAASVARTLKRLAA